MIVKSYRYCELVSDQGCNREAEGEREKKREMGELKNVIKWKATNRKIEKSKCWTEIKIERHDENERVGEADEKEIWKGGRGQALKRKGKSKR